MGASTALLLPSAMQDAYSLIEAQQETLQYHCTLPKKVRTYYLCPVVLYPNRTLSSAVVQSRLLVIRPIVFPCELGAQKHNSDHKDDESHELLAVNEMKTKLQAWMGGQDHNLCMPVAPPGKAPNNNSVEEVRAELCR